MKIMFYINSLAGGGAQRVMANLANMFAEDGFEVIFVTSFSAEGEYELGDKVMRRCISDLRIDSFVKRNISYIMGLRRIVKEIQPDVLLSFMSEPNYRCILSTLGLDVKRVISVRCDPVREYSGKIGRFLAKYVLPMADGCVFQTQDARAWFPEKLQNKSRIIVNAVKKDFYSVERHAVPGRIVTLGRLSNQKNHKLLIDAFAIAVEQYPHAQLYIYGDGNLRPELEAYIGQKNLHEKVRLMGNTSDVSGVLSSADCFVLSSDYEGMPNALMEAMAAGVPCISTACPCGGPEMLIKDGVSGLLTPVGEVQPLVVALEKILSNEIFAQQLGTEGKKAAQEFLPEKVFQDWKGYLNSFVK